MTALYGAHNRARTQHTMTLSPAILASEPAPDIRRVTTHRLRDVDTILVEHWRSGSVSHLGLGIDGGYNSEPVNEPVRTLIPMRDMLVDHCLDVEYRMGRLCYYRSATEEDLTEFAKVYK